LATRGEELDKLDLESFPKADDFIVEIKDLESETALKYVVPSWGISIGFPWWDVRASEMRGWTLSDIPTGSLGRPYWDSDFGWTLMIWEFGERVFIMNGADTEELDEPEIFEIWYTIPRDLYRSAWKAALDGL
jgi:hypothetical protein